MFNYTCYLNDCTIFLMYPFMIIEEWFLLLRNHSLTLIHYAGHFTVYDALKN